MVGTATGRAVYARLFAAQAIGILATGIATVALALLAFSLADDYAGAVLGTALAIKMATNIVVAPLAAAMAGGFPRRRWLSFLAVARAGTLFTLPFVSEVWQVYVLIAIFQTAAAASAAAYLATVPDILPDPDDYAAAVGKSQIAYEAETLLSPLIAAVLLSVLDHRDLFIVAVGLFLVSAVALSGPSLPAGRRPEGRLLQSLGRDFLRLTGARPMRGALLVHAAAVVIAAMVTVNTVVLVRGRFDLEDTAVAIALAAFGGGGITAALMLPSLLLRLGERALMLRCGALMAALLVSGALLPGYGTMLALWAGLGATSTLAQLPVSTLIRRMSRPGERQGLYAAHYAISHTLLLIAYLAAGWVGVEAGFVGAFLSLGLMSIALVAAAAVTWPRDLAPGRAGAPVS
jgi:MFS family permease